MKYTTILLLACLLAVGFSKEWKRVADLPDYNDDDLKIPQEQQQDPLQELEQIFSKLSTDPSGNKELSRAQYTELLKDLILGTGRVEVEQQKDSIAGVQHKLMNSIIDDYVEQEGKESFTMQNLLEDLEQERLLKYIDKVYKRKLESMEL